MKPRYFWGVVLCLLSVVAGSNICCAIDLASSQRSRLYFNGYSRLGYGASGIGGVQSNFIMPESQSKYRLGNEADYYAEFNFKYSHLFGEGLDKSFDLAWTLAAHRDYGKYQDTDLTYVGQLYAMLNNTLGHGESIWMGRRYYDRKYIEIIDRYWLNSAQDGYGIGIENLLPGEEDLKFAIISFADRDLAQYQSYSRSNSLFNYNVDVRWEGKRVGEYSDINLAFNYTLRPANETWGYETRHGFGLFAWIDYQKDNTQNYLAAIFRQGANVVTNNGTGRAVKENQFNDRRVIADLRNTRYFELSDNFLYDNHKSYAVEAVALAMMQDFGTDPYLLELDGTKTYYSDLGSRYYWFTLGVRNMFYICDFFRINLSLSSEYAIINHIDDDGFLNKITFMPEFAQRRSYGQKPVLRPYITYASWSESLTGYIGTSPTGAGYGGLQTGFTYGLQLEISW